ncbi:hypothetical protein OUY22_16230, partial [Nonomuraea sp. MCN248]|nr:hypothetical protein [Nonomuraea corallina]
GLKWAQCMRENGVDVPDPKPGEGIRMTLGPGTEKKLEQAQKACEQWQPPAGGRPRAESDGELREIAACMRRNGVEDFPDPEGGRVHITKDVGDDPDFEAAQRTCQKDKPGPGSK